MTLKKKASSQAQSAYDEASFFLKGPITKFYIYIYIYKYNFRKIVSGKGNFKSQSINFKYFVYFHN